MSRSSREPSESCRGACRVGTDGGGGVELRILLVAHDVVDLDDLALCRLRLGCEVDQLADRGEEGRHKGLETDEQAQGQLAVHDLQATDRQNEHGRQAGQRRRYHGQAVGESPHLLAGQYVTGLEAGPPFVGSVLRSAGLDRLDRGDRGHAQSRSIRN